MALEYFKGFEDEARGRDIPSAPPATPQTNVLPPFHLERDVAEYLLLRERLLREVSDAPELPIHAVHLTNLAKNPFHFRYLEYRGLKLLGYDIHIGDIAQTSQGRPIFGIAVHAGSRDAEAVRRILEPSSQNTAEATERSKVMKKFLRAVTSDRVHAHHINPAHSSSPGLHDQLAAHFSPTEADSLIRRGFLTSRIITGVMAAVMERPLGWAVDAAETQAYESIRQDHRPFNPEELYGIAAGGLPR